MILVGIMKDIRSNKAVVAIIIAVVVVVGAILTLFVIANFNDTDYNVTITRVERIVESNGETIDSKYLVYCEQEDGSVIVFENTDTLIRGKFNSSDIYAQLKEEHKYTITVVGFRIPFLSMYQNIIEVKELQNNV